VSSSFQAGAEEKYGSFAAAAIYAPQNRDKVEAAFKDEFAKVVRDGFTAEEVETAKKALLTSQTLSRSQDRSLVTNLANQARYGWTMERTERIEKKVASLTVAEVNAAAKKWIDPASFSIVKAGDFKKAGLSQ
jgi:zinc protease